jgi:hypothetical protein
MVGKRVQFDDETWETIQEVARQRGRTFQQLADEACGASARRYGQPVPRLGPESLPSLARGTHFCNESQKAVIDTQGT